MNTAEQLTELVLSDVAFERVRQTKKWGFQDIAPAQYGIILGEEYGEVCKEVCDHHMAGLDPKRVSELRAELIQVAAVAVQFVEYLDRRTNGSPVLG